MEFWGAAIDVAFFFLKTEIWPFEKIGFTWFYNRLMVAYSRGQTRSWFGLWVSYATRRKVYNSWVPEIIGNKGKFQTWTCTPAKHILSYGYVIVVASFMVRSMMPVQREYNCQIWVSIQHYEQIIVQNYFCRPKTSSWCFSTYPQVIKGGNGKLPLVLDFPIAPLSLWISQLAMFDYPIAG